MSEEVFLTPEQIARKLQVKEPTVYTWLRSGHLRGVKLGRLWRVRPADFEAFVQQRATEES